MAWLIEELDKNCFGGGVCIYVNQDIAGRRVEYNSLNNIESICLELNLRKRKSLVIGRYKFPSYSEDALKKSLFFCRTNATKEFNNIVLLGDFNMTIFEINFLRVTKRLNSTEI